MKMINEIDKLKKIGVITEREMNSINLPMDNYQKFKKIVNKKFGDIEKIRFHKNIEKKNWTIFEIKKPKWKVDDDFCEYIGYLLCLCCIVFISFLLASGEKKENKVIKENIGYSVYKRRY